MDPAVPIVLIIFGMPVAIVAQYYKFKMAQLRARQDQDPKQLEKDKEERKQLEARVQNLESIVCSVDLELNARMNRMLAAQSAIGALPPHRPDDKAAPAATRPQGSVLAMALTPGQKIADRYTIERELGRGGMGAVFLATDGKLSERVALKIINAGYGDPSAIDRFRREVAAARKVTHPNVIRIHDLVEDGGMVLLSMEYVDGMTLAQYLGRVGALRVDEARFVVGQVCDGVAAAHSAGVVHRDLKPGNVLLDHEKRVKVIDFGLAKATFMHGMTATGLIIGTPEYMAPEQVKGLPQDARTDVYAIGALAYHVFVGRPPFAGETPIAIGFAHVSEAPRPPRELRPDLPESIDKAILQALEKDPGKRFQDAAELKRALVS
ncbi:MAG: serine/threonine-protein kinase [Polyangia bacterium]